MDFENSDVLNQLPTDQDIPRWNDSYSSDNDSVAEMPDDEEGQTFWAIKHDTDLFKTLLEKNKDLAFLKSENDYSVLHAACSEGNVEAVKILLQANCHVNIVNGDGWTPLHSACKWNNISVVKLLLHNGADVNATSHGGLTPVHVAANPHGKSPGQLLTLLLSRRCVDVTSANNGGDTVRDLIERHSKAAPLLEMQAEHLRNY